MRRVIGPLREETQTDFSRREQSDVFLTVNSWVNLRGIENTWRTTSPPGPMYLDGYAAAKKRLDHSCRLWFVVSDEDHVRVELGSPVVGQRDRTMESRIVSKLRIYDSFGASLQKPLSTEVKRMNMSVI